MSGTIGNVKVQPCQVIFDDVDVGFTNGDLDIKPKEHSVDIKAHQEGSNVLDSIRTGKEVTLSVTFIETTLAKLQSLLARGGGSTGAVAEVATLLCVADSSSSLHGKTFPLIAKDGTKYLFQLKTGTLAAPVIPGWTVVQITITANDADTVVADAIAAAVDGLAGFTAPNPAGATITITQASTGIVAAGSGVGNTGFTYNVTTPGTNLLTGWGKSKDFTGMVGSAAKLVLHPIALGDYATATDFTEDLAFWLAYPELDSIKRSGEKEGTFTANFKIFPDSSQDDAVRLFSVGDHT